MEFRHFGVWWVVDPTWQHPCLCLRSEIYHEYRPQILHVCKHHEFWSYPISSQFEEKLKKPDTSHLFYELQHVYSHYRGSPTQFHPHIAKKKLDPEAGRYLNFKMYLAYPQVILSDRIFRQFMTKPSRTRPKARSIRKVKSCQKILQREYAQWLATQETEKSDTPTTTRK